MVTAKDLRDLTKDLTILYAEDEEWLRTNMTDTLKRLFKNVLIAEDGREALELYRTNEVDLILTDINMPHMNGVELLEAVKDSNDLPVPSVVLTAHNESEMMQQLIDLNIDKFLNKPVDKEKMIVALYKVCRMISDARLVEEYRESLANALIETEKKNRILETKLNQIAEEKNSQREKKEIVEESKSSPERKKFVDDYFATLINEDREELNDLSSEIDSYITRMFQTDLVNDEYLDLLSKAYRKYAAVLNSYPVFFELGTGLTRFSQLIDENRQLIQKKQNECALLFESIHFTLDNFRINIWYHESDNPTFYHASLVNDFEHIENFLLDKNIESEMEFF